VDKFFHSDFTIEAIIAGFFKINVARLINPLQGEVPVHKYVVQNTQQGVFLSPIPFLAALQS
jgi:hypothetical protein